MVGSTFKRVNIEQIRNFSIPFPPSDEQTLIATALSDTDSLISNLEKLIAKKRNIKQGAMQKLMSESGFSGLKDKQNFEMDNNSVNSANPINSDSDNWEVKKLGEILKVKHGKSQKEVEVKGGKFPILGTGGLMGFTNHFLSDKPSVLIGRKGTIDKPQYMETPFWTVDTLFYTEIFDGYNAKFVFYVFNLIDWYSFNEASGVPSLNAKTIEKIEISFPSFKEQTRIATILSDMDAEIAALGGKLAKYRDIKLGMMQVLLTGKIRLVNNCVNKNDCF
jgi:type I restriction enzyme S subunit